MLPVRANEYGLISQVMNPAGAPLFKIGKPHAEGGNEGDQPGLACMAVVRYLPVELGMQVAFVVRFAVGAARFKDWHLRIP